MFVFENDCLSFKSLSKCAVSELPFSYCFSYFSEFQGRQGCISFSLLPTVSLDRSLMLVLQIKVWLAFGLVCYRLW